MVKNKLRTFVFVNGGRVISPPLVTVREYAKWLETVYDEYTCNYELYIRATVGGTKVLEFHPGTRIGQYFDNTEFNSNKYDSWYVYQDSNVMEKLNKMKFAEYRDIAPILSGDKKGMKLLRLYSIDQIVLYIRTKIDRDFNINTFLSEPKKITLRNGDMKKLISPQIKKVRRSLLDTSDIPVLMTVKDIEDKLGHKVIISS